MSLHQYKFSKKDYHKQDFFQKAPVTNLYANRAESHEKFKTELCRNLESGFCEFGDKCFFAHSLSELRNKSTFITLKHLKCKSFFESGYCLSGAKCQYSHKEIFPETAESSPITSSKTSRKASGDTRIVQFIDLETRPYN